MHGVVTQEGQARLWVRWENMALQRPTAFAWLRAAVLEIAEWNHKRYFAVLVVKHCTSDLGCNPQSLAVVSGLAHSRVGTALDSRVVVQEMRKLVLGSTQGTPLPLLPLELPMVK